MIAQRLRLAAAIIVAGFVCACSNPGAPPPSFASGPLQATALHRHGVVGGPVTSEVPKLWRSIRVLTPSTLPPGYAAIGVSPGGRSRR